MSLPLTAPKPFTQYLLPYAGCGCLAGLWDFKSYDRKTGSVISGGTGSGSVHTLIMQQAYSQANEIVTLASHQAQEILDNATIEANNMNLAS